ncbi:MAG: hypothetical protein U0793_33570 [Gemmataceae bacterium]
MLFTYVMPKGVEPDRVDVDEWKGYKAEQPMMDEMMPILKGMEPSLPLAIVREMRPGLTDGKARLMGHVVEDGVDGFPALAGGDTGGGVGAAAGWEESAGQTA